MAMQSDEEWSANLESELIRIAHDQEQSYIQEQRFADGRRVAQEQQKLAQEQYEKAQEQQRMAEEQRRTLSKPKPKRIRHKQPSQVVVQPPPIAVPVPGPPPTPFLQKMTLVDATYSPHSTELWHQPSRLQPQPTLQYERGYSARQSGTSPSMN